MSEKPIYMLYAGSFGKAVADHCKALRNHIEVAAVLDHTEPDYAAWSAARMTVVASWRPLPKLCDRIDELSHELRRPFIPLIQDSTSLRLGPVVIPGAGPCWRCWIQRSRQHAEWTNAQVAVMKHYAESPEAGPQGYLEPFAAMASIRLVQTIAEVDSSRAQGGHIWQIDLLSREITTSAVIGVHGCKRCGMQRPEATRSVDEIRRELQYLWTAPGAET
jgi:bacteriocin biosynthesis cyclodehydratase domain-containing protein